LGGFGADRYPVLISEEELVEAALLKYAQQQATKWGAKRFSAEFERRDLEERWLEAARSHTTPYAPTQQEDSVPPPDVPAGPVDATIQDRVIGSDREWVSLARPKYERHSSVPRPPAPPVERRRRRDRRRKHEGSTNDPAWMISPAEAARMSAAGRRLYGLDGPSDRTR
jgi:hypothetical protein